MLDFVAAMEGSSIREAALRLQGYGDHGSARVVVPAAGSKERKLVTKKRSLNSLLSFALELDPSHPYLARRGIQGGTADHFGVGYCGHGLMMGRIAIPIYNDAGGLVAYCGRALDGVELSCRFPAGFQKSQLLFHSDRARTAGSSQVIVVVEGFFDCVRVYQAGFPNVVALVEARLSSAQKTLLTARFGEVVLLFDCDAAGREATRHICSHLEGACAVRPLLLPLGVQPDQMSRDEVRQLLAGKKGGSRPA